MMTEFVAPQQMNQIQKRIDPMNIQLLNTDRLRNLTRTITREFSHKNYTQVMKNFNDIQHNFPKWIDCPFYYDIYPLIIISKIELHDYKSFREFEKWHIKSFPGFTSSRLLLGEFTMISVPYLEKAVKKLAENLSENDVDLYRSAVYIILMHLVNHLGFEFYNDDQFLVNEKISLRNIMHEISSYLGYTYISESNLIQVMEVNTRSGYNLKECFLFDYYPEMPYDAITFQIRCELCDMISSFSSAPEIPQQQQQQEQEHEEKQGERDKPDIPMDLVVISLIRYMFSIGDWSRIVKLIPLAINHQVDSAVIPTIVRMILDTNKNNTPNIKSILTDQLFNSENYTSDQMYDLINAVLMHMIDHIDMLAITNLGKSKNLNIFMDKAIDILLQKTIVDDLIRLVRISDEIEDNENLKTKFTNFWVKYYPKLKNVLITENKTSNSLNTRATLSGLLARDCYSEWINPKISDAERIKYARYSLNYYIIAYKLYYLQYKDFSNRVISDILGYIDDIIEGIAKFDYGTSRNFKAVIHQTLASKHDKRDIDGLLMYIDQQIEIHGRNYPDLS